MGGASDEVSLVPPAVVAITEVFGEHLGVLGDTPAEIAADKAGVVAEVTRAVVSLPQTPDVAAAIEATVAARTGRRAEVVTETPPALPGEASEAPAAPGTPEAPATTPAAPAAPGAAGAPAARGPSARYGSHGLPSLSRLQRPNALLGCAAARRLLDATGRPGPDPARTAEVLASVRLPGRVSWHEIPGATLLVDSAVEANGAAAALAEAYRRWDRIDHVLVCLPDHKDLEGVLSALGGLPVTTVRMPDRESLRFTRTHDGIDIADLTPGRLAAFGDRIVVLGTVYFTGRVLDLVGADTTRLFAA
jgi:dihydrofolate synthase/folylpolyglutamate synthase